MDLLRSIFPSRWFPDLKRDYSEEGVYKQEDVIYFGRAENTPDCAVRYDDERHKERWLVRVRGSLVLVSKEPLCR